MIINPHILRWNRGQQFGHSWAKSGRWAGSWMFVSGSRKWSRSWGSESNQDKVSRR